MHINIIFNSHSIPVRLVLLSFLRNKKANLVKLNNFPQKYTARKWLNSHLNLGLTSKFPLNPIERSCGKDLRFVFRLLISFFLKKIN